MKAPFALLITVFLAVPYVATSMQGGASARALAQTGTTQAAAGDAGMTNADVVKLVRAGLSDALVVQTIRQAAATKFDTSTDALVQLKSSGVSDAVIATMLAPKARATDSAAPFPSAAPGNVPPTQEAGIYLETDGLPEHAVPLEPTVFSQAKAGGMFASAMTYGLYKAKIKAVVRGPKAKVRASDKRPTFYFHFDQQSSRLGPGAFSGWLAGASGPNEFVLAQMIQKRDSRELVVGEWGAFTSSSGARTEDIVPIDAQKLAPGVYKVTPTEDLGAGEFCFFYAAGVNALGASVVGKLFDFGADATRR